MVTLEFILAAPLVVIAIVATLEFGILALTLQLGHAALIEGTRRAAEVYPDAYPLEAPGFNNDIADAVVEVVNLYLAVQGLEVYDSTQELVDDPNRPNAQIVIERNGVIASRGDALNFPEGFICTPSGDPPDLDEVRVTLCFRIVNTGLPSGYSRPVPDWLNIYSISLANNVFEASARMPLE